MLKTGDHLPENTVVYKEFTIEQARDYEQRRYIRHRKMRKLDKFEKALAQNIFDMVGTNSHILDIPCGSGRFFEIFSKAEKLTMADYSIDMLKVCEEKYEIPENVQLIQADISSIPLSDKSMDLCFCMRLFHHMKNDQVMLGALKELSRISRKYVAVTFYNKNSLRFYRRKLLGKKIRGSYVTLKHIVGLAKQAGLEPLDSFRLNFIEQQCLELFRKV